MNCIYSSLSRTTSVMLAIVFVFITQRSFSQMTLEVTSVPQLTPLLDDVYVAGSFNNWNPSDENFKLTVQGNVWSVVIPAQSEPAISFKFTRGTSWDTVEGSSVGSYIPDRTLSFENGTTQQLQIAGWEDLAGNHTVTDNVRVLDMDFNIPQLNRTRRIWITLPDGYDTSTETYPVIYMHDGQNLFSSATSFAGEWQVDEAVDSEYTSCVEPVIVVGIDNGGAARIDELAPWVNEEYNEGGEGALYSNFIVETLKPFVDENFRTKHEREHTAVGGSSLGALISMYMIAKHNDVFSKAALVSPAFWFNEEITEYVQTHPLSADSRLYFICGDSESGSMVGDMQQMYNVVANNQVPASNVAYQVVAGGQHNEFYWSQQFPVIYSTLFDCTVSVDDQTVEERFILMPNPAGDTLEIRTKTNQLMNDIEIYSDDGKLIKSRNSINDTYIQLNISEFASGTYFLKIKSGKTETTKAFLKK